MSNFEGEFFMTNQQSEEVVPVLIVSTGDLGSGNLGTFGPNSKTEAECTKDFANEKYVCPPANESHCMDDRFEGTGIQLPGNRAHVEVIGDYMNPEVYPKPIIEATAQKVDELIGLGRRPFYHGDRHAGKAGCAANKYGRKTLAYNSEHRTQVARLAYNRMRILGFDKINEKQILVAIDMGGERAADERLWNGGAEEIVETAIAHGAGYEEFEGEHNTPGPREDISVNTFDNGSYRHDHHTDDGQPLGALSVTYGAYGEQLVDDGLDDDEIETKMMNAVLTTIGILKLACKDEAVSVTVG
jgi:hypothetical protein